MKKSEKMGCWPVVLGVAVFWIVVIYALCDWLAN